MNTVYEIIIETYKILSTYFKIPFLHKIKPINPRTIAMEKPNIIPKISPSLLSGFVIIIIGNVFL